MSKQDTILVSYNGEAETVKNRYGIFVKGVVIKLSRAIGEAVLKYPLFQEETQEKEKNKKGGE